MDETAFDHQDDPIRLPGQFCRYCCLVGLSASYFGALVDPSHDRYIMDLLGLF
jgi:hypothetical protein